MGGGKIMALGNKPEIDINNGVIINTPIGQLDLRFYEKDSSGLKNVVRIINNDKNIVVIPAANNKINLFSYDCNEFLSVGKEER